MSLKGQPLVFDRRLGTSVAIRTVFSSFRQVALAAKTRSLNLLRISNTATCFQ